MTNPKNDCASLVFLSADMIRPRRPWSWTPDDVRLHGSALSRTRRRGERQPDDARSSHIHDAKRTHDDNSQGRSSRRGKSRARPRYRPARVVRPDKLRECMGRKAPRRPPRRARRAHARRPTRCRAYCRGWRLADVGAATSPGKSSLGPAQRARRLVARAEPPRRLRPDNLPRSLKREMTSSPPKLELRRTTSF